MINQQKILSQMNVDKRVLRYMIVDAQWVHSTANNEPYGTWYIYVKPGNKDEVMNVSNIDFVQAVYASYGINLKKHMSHLHGKATEVLFIGMSEVSELDKMQRDFLHDTAPINYASDDEVKARETTLINQIFQKQR